MGKLKTVPVPRKLPVVLSREEVSRLLEATSSLKYKAAFSVAYGAGLRMNEVATLKISDIDGERWIHCRPGFFLPVRVLSRLFRRLFLERLVEACQAGELKFFGEHQALTDAGAFPDWTKPLRKIEWVVYAKRPFAGPEAVLAYLYWWNGENRMFLYSSLPARR